MRDEIDQHVCAVFEITLEELLSKSRRGPIPDARKVAVYFARKNDGTFQEIAQHYNIERTTVHACIAKLSDLISVNDSIVKKIKQVEQLIPNQKAE